jgi:formylmethanofuran dehydrogenase subunit E
VTTCKHGMNEAWCAVCTPLTSSEPEKVVAMTAKIETKCNGCGEQIVPHDPIFLVDDVWVCRACKEAS